MNSADEFSQNQILQANNLIQNGQEEEAYDILQ
jgi:hypothetical protein